MAKHTPGPWHVRSKFVGPLEIVRNHDDAQPIAMVGADSFALCAANAELIAAAPDMLAALRELAVIAEQNIEDLCADAQEGAPIAKMELFRWQGVLNAIRKAEGGHD